MQKAITQARINAFKPVTRKRARRRSAVIAMNPTIGSSPNLLAIRLDSNMHKAVICWAILSSPLQEDQQSFQ